MRLDAWALSHFRAKSKNMSQSSRQAGPSNTAATPSLVFWWWFLSLLRLLGQVLPNLVHRQNRPNSFHSTKKEVLYPKLAAMYVEVSSHYYPQSWELLDPRRQRCGSSSAQVPAMLPPDKTWVELWWIDSCCKSLHKLSQTSPLFHVR